MHGDFNKALEEFFHYQSALHPDPQDQTYVYIRCIDHPGRNPMRQWRNTTAPDPDTPNKLTPIRLPGIPCPTSTM